jgi:tetratricopeptide (TPR) repeat protein
MDTRLVLRTAAEYTEYLGLSDYPERFAKFQAKSHFRYVLLPVAFPERYQGLIAELYASPEWRLIFTDGSDVLFGRSEDAPNVAVMDLSRDETTDALLSSLRARFGTSPKLYTAARLHLATLETLLKEFAQADRVLERIDAPEARSLQARAHFAEGDLEAAERIARAELSRDRYDLSSLNLLALIALRRGELVQGTMYLRRALAIAPYDSEATQTLAHLEEPVR